MSKINLTSIANEQCFVKIGNSIGVDLLVETAQRAAKLQSGPILDAAARRGLRMSVVILLKRQSLWILRAVIPLHGPREPFDTMEVWDGKFNGLPLWHLPDDGSHRVVRNLRWVVAARIQTKQPLPKGRWLLTSATKL